MITSISYQYRISKNFIAPKPAGEIAERKFYGEKDTKDLEKMLTEDLAELTSMRGLVSFLNSDAYKNSECSVSRAILIFYPGTNLRITKKTKTKRTYSIMNLTIHEEDEVTELTHA